MNPSRRLPLPPALVAGTLFVVGCSRPAAVPVEPAPVVAQPQPAAADEPPGTFRFADDTGGKLLGSLLTPASTPAGAGAAPSERPLPAPPGALTQQVPLAPPYVPEMPRLPSPLTPPTGLPGRVNSEPVPFPDEKSALPVRPVLPTTP